MERDGFRRLARVQQLGEHLTGKGTISFRYGERLPATLVKKIVRTRLAEARAREARRR